MNLAALLRLEAFSTVVSVSASGTWKRKRQRKETAEQSEKEEKQYHAQNLTNRRFPMGGSANGTPRN